MKRAISGFAGAMAVSVCLLSSAVSGFGAGVSDAAYPLLWDRTQTNRQAFYVYRDADSGLNHGFPSGFFGIASKVQLDTACIDDPNSTNGCSGDPNRLDRSRSTVMRFTFSPFSRGEFAGVNIEEPEHWGSNKTGVGYDLTGASNVVFDIRNPTGKTNTVLVGVGGTFLRSVRLPSSTNWATISLPLDLSPAQLTNVHLLFAVSADYDLTREGGTFLLDNIWFEPVPWKHTNALGFPLSNETFGVLPRTTPASGGEPFPLDQVLRNLSTPYESALTSFALLERGTISDLAAARLIADTFVYALNHDNHGGPVISMCRKMARIGA